MTFSVVIPAFNEEAILGRTLEAVYAAAAAGASCEVIVVDNASTDGTAEIAARSGARVITEPVHNIARVRNTGAAAALGDVLVFLDADTLVPRPARRDRKCFPRLGGYDESIYMGDDIEFYWRMARHAKRTGTRVHFVEKPRVLTSSRRFDRMSLWRTLLLTHPIFIRLSWKRKSVWRDWYDEPVR